MTSRTIDIRTILPKDAVDDETCDYIQSLCSSAEPGTVKTVKEMLSEILSKKDLRKAMKSIRTAVKVASSDESDASTGLSTLAGAKSLIEGADSDKPMSALDISSASTMLHTQRYHSQRREKAKGKKAAKDASPEQTPVPAPTGDKFEGLDEHVESVLWTTSRGRADIGESTSVNLKRLTISIDSKELLKDATLRLNGGEVYGLVGRNGVGEYGVALCLHCLRLLKGGCCPLAYLPQGKQRCCDTL